MNILVTGANGQLGNEMRIVAKNSKNKYVFTDVIENNESETILLDITDIDSLRDIVGKYNISVVVNCAAYTNVDKAETDVDLCTLLNTKAPENLAIVMKEVAGTLIHISTDYVFGGDPYNIPCKEDQKGTPTGVYGLTKLQGEEAIKAINCNHIIIRTAWLYSEFGKNFVKTMLSLTANKEELNVVFDQTGTPTYALDLANVIYDIIENNKYRGNDGIYHFSNEGVCSWFDFTKMIAEYAGNTKCNIKPCHSDEFPSPVKRPSYSVLDKTKIKEAFKIDIPYWTESLKNCINNLLTKQL